MKMRTLIMTVSAAAAAAAAAVAEVESKSAAAKLDVVPPLPEIPEPDLTELQIESAKRVEEG